ncbi:MAG: ABC transporter substrate-binding protein [Granulosicoccaceae bacterium]
MSNAAFDIEILSNSLYDTLIKLDQNGFAVPSLAENWEVLEEGLLFRFTLREGVEFHTVNGFTPTRTMNADDVVFSFNRLLNADAYFAEIGGRQAVATVFPSDKVASVTGEGLSVDIRLSSPDVELVEKLSGHDTNIQSLEYAQYLEANNKSGEFVVLPVGTGPFSFEGRSQKRFNLAKFDRYWAQSAEISGLEFIAEPDDLERLSRLRRGDCAHAVDLGSRILQPSMSFDGFRVERAPILSILFLALDTRQYPWSDIQVRQALSLAINRERILRLLFVAGSGQQASLPIHPSLLGQWKAELPEFDRARAKRLLQDVSDGRVLKLKITTFDVPRPHNPNPRRMAQLVALDLREVGIDVELEWVPAAQILDVVSDVENRRYESLLMGYSADVPLASSLASVLMGCSNGGPKPMNFSRFCDPAISSLLKRASTEVEADKRMQLYRDVAEASQEKMQYINILHAEYVDVIREDVVGVRRQSNGLFDFRQTQKN